MKVCACFGRNKLRVEALLTPEDQAHHQFTVGPAFQHVRVRFGGLIFNIPLHTLSA